VGKSAPKGKNPVASTSTQPKEQESPDDEQDEEADGEVVPDESFDADWSGDLMCVADPFVVTKVRASPPLQIPAQCQHLPELCWSNQEVYVYPVHARMQKHWGHAAAGDISGVDFLKGTPEPRWWPE